MTQPSFARRSLVGGAAATLCADTLGAASVSAQTPERAFGEWLRGFRGEAQRAGISVATLDLVFTGMKANQRVIELDRKQPEFTLTWAKYRETRLSETRIARGRQEMATNATLLKLIEDRWGVPGRYLVAIWGLETSYGGYTGGFSTLEVLSTLAWEGRRASYFKRELMSALQIIESGEAKPGQLTGSWAGAMGNPQFMPSSFQRLAVDFDGDGKRDIWSSRADSLASIANYLARSNWQRGEPWGRAVTVPAGFDATLAVRTPRRPVAEWTRLGVRAVDGTALAVAEPAAGVLLPDGAGGPAYAVHRNFDVFRAYNPSDFYALCVGLLADAIAS